MFARLKGIKTKRKKKLATKSVTSVLDLLEKDSALNKNDALKRKLGYIKDSCDSVYTKVQDLTNLTI